MLKQSPLFSLNNSTLQKAFIKVTHVKLLNTLRAIIIIGQFYSVVVKCHKSS